MAGRSNIAGNPHLLSPDLSGAFCEALHTLRTNNSRERRTAIKYCSACAGPVSGQSASPRGIWDTKGRHRRPGAVL
jgi:hypothetical protein